MPDLMSAFIQSCCWLYWDYCSHSYSRYCYCPVPEPRHMWKCDKESLQLTPFAICWIYSNMVIHIWIYFSFWAACYWHCRSLVTDAVYCYSSSIPWVQSLKLLADGARYSHKSALFSVPKSSKSSYGSSDLYPAARPSGATYSTHMKLDLMQEQLVTAEMIENMSMSNCRAWWLIGVMQIHHGITSCALI
jgi:hypothetical protein